jgi:hypothetical protein
MRTRQRVLGSSRREINATRTIAAALGVFAGVSGLDHGLFETLQGNAPTPGLFIQSIGPSQRMWVYGTEDAFTLVPNFLASGILAMAMGVLISVWSIGFIHRPHGSVVFLVLGMGLFLVGGGVAQVAFIALGWAVSRRIDRPWTGRRNFLPAGVDRVLARRWWALLLAGLAFGVVALEIAITGFVPGVTDPDRIQVICWTALGAMLIVLLLAIVAGAAHDAERQAHQLAVRGPR